MSGRFLLIALAVLFLSSCPSTPPTFYFEKPEGFAFAEPDKGERLSAASVSPEGLIFDVTMSENYPVKEIGFWGKALKNQFINNGYKLYKEEEFPIESGNKGIMYEWLAPYASNTYVYLTYITVEGDFILIAEAAGEINLFSDYRESIVRSIKTISFNQKE